MPLGIGREIHLRAVGGHRHFGLGFGKGNALTGNLHIRRVGLRFDDQGSQLRIVKRFPPCIFRPLAGRQPGLYVRDGELLIKRCRRIVLRGAGNQKKRKRQAETVKT